MVSKTDLEIGIEEMDFSMVDNGSGLSLPTSTPATYEFRGDTELDVDALAVELSEHDFTLHDVRHDEREDGAFYCYARVLTDHYKDVRIKVWNEIANLYPQDEEPDTYEFTRIVKAIEEAFGAALEYSQSASFGDRGDNGE